MDKILRYLALVILLPLALSGSVFAVNPSPAKGEKLPIISLPMPKNSVEKIYLGLQGDGFFKIQQIKAKAVVIKVFNLYCPVCQSTANAMVELYRQIENHPEFKGKIKLIGIGAGNSSLEVEVFKQNHHIPFPVFPDEDFKIHKVLQEVRTPFFIAVKMAGDGSYEIVYTHLGGITDARAFLELIIEAYGMKQEDPLIKEAASSPNESSSKR